MINNPRFLGGSMDKAAGEKSARLMQLCDTFHLPLIYFCDEPGFMVGLAEEKKGIVRAGARIVSLLSLSRMPYMCFLIRQAYGDALDDQPTLGEAFRADIVATVDRDPATLRFLEPVLYYKGFHAIQTHRLAHWLVGKGRKDFALYLQSRSSSVFQCDINPAAKIGRGIFLDHATGLVVGETAVIEDDVSILHDVTLGGTGKENEDRHPKSATA